MPGWIFDEKEYPVNVTVIDNDGQLEPYIDTVPTVTNTFMTPCRNISVKITWVDQSKQKKPLPANVPVQLLGDGQPMKNASLNKRGGWAFIFRDVPEFRTGLQNRGNDVPRVEYAVLAGDVPGFTRKTTGNADDGFVITYTATRDVPVTGDTTNLPLLGGMLLVSAGTLLALLRRRRKAS